MPYVKTTTSRLKLSCVLCLAMVLVSVSALAVYAKSANQPNMRRAGNSLCDLNRRQQQADINACLQKIEDTPLAVEYAGGDVRDGQGRVVPGHVDGSKIKNSLTGLWKKWGPTGAPLPLSALQYDVSAKELENDYYDAPPTTGDLLTDVQMHMMMKKAAMELAAKMSAVDRVAPAAAAAQQSQATAAGDAAAEAAEDQSASAIGYCAQYLTNFTAEPNQWTLVRDQIFVPMAVLLLLPGAILAQARAIVAAGSPVLGEVNPFEGILRSIVAIFLIPGTALVMNYGIDLSNSITYTISSEFTRLFGKDMYKVATSAEVRATSTRPPQSNRNAYDQATAQMGQGILGAQGPFSVFEKYAFEDSIQDPDLGINQAPENLTNESLPAGVVATRLMMNGSNAGLAAAWNILCAFQLAYLYYLWCVGPIMAALWVYPLRTLRNALPSWIEGVVTLCFWSLFWNTVILLMACFKGVDETGTVLMTALNFLATASVKYAFDFAGLVKAAGQEAAGMAMGAAQQAAQNAGGGGGAARGAHSRSSAGGAHNRAAGAHHGAGQQAHAAGRGHGVHGGHGADAQLASASSGPGSANHGSGSLHGVGEDALGTGGSHGFQAGGTLESELARLHPLSFSGDNDAAFDHPIPPGAAAGFGQDGAAITDPRLLAGEAAFGDQAAGDLARLEAKDDFWLASFYAGDDIDQNLAAFNTGDDINQNRFDGSTYEGASYDGASYLASYEANHSAYSLDVNGNVVGASHGTGSLEGHLSALMAMHGGPHDGLPPTAENRLHPPDGAHKPHDFMGSSADYSPHSGVPLPVREGDDHFHLDGSGLPVNVPPLSGDGDRSFVDSSLTDNSLSFHDNSLSYTDSSLSMDSSLLSHETNNSFGDLVNPLLASNATDMTPLSHGMTLNPDLNGRGIDGSVNGLPNMLRDDISGAAALTGGDLITFHPPGAANIDFAQVNSTGDLTFNNSYSNTASDTTNSFSDISQNAPLNPLGGMQVTDLNMTPVGNGTSIFSAQASDGPIGPIPNTNVFGSSGAADPSTVVGNQGTAGSPMGSSETPTTYISDNQPITTDGAPLIRSDWSQTANQSFDFSVTNDGGTLTPTSAVQVQYGDDGTLTPGGAAGGSYAISPEAGSFTTTSQDGASFTTPAAEGGSFLQCTSYAANYAPTYEQPTGSAFVNAPSFEATTHNGTTNVSTSAQSFETNQGGYQSNQQSDYVQQGDTVQAASASEARYASYSTGGAADSANWTTSFSPPPNGYQSQSPSDVTYVSSGGAAMSAGGSSEFPTTFLASHQPPTADINFSGSADGGTLTPTSAIQVQYSDDGNLTPGTVAGAGAAPPVTYVDGPSYADGGSWE